MVKCIHFQNLVGPTNGNVKRFLGFSVYISDTTDKEDGVLCFKDDYLTKYTIPSVITLNCTHHGRYVFYYNNRTSTSKPADYSEHAYNDLCEFEVYGASCSSIIELFALPRINMKCDRDFKKRLELSKNQRNCLYKYFNALVLEVRWFIFIIFFNLCKKCDHFMQILQFNICFMS